MLSGESATFAHHANALTPTPEAAALMLKVATPMSRVSPLTALNPAFACPSFKASVAHAMERSIPAFRFPKLFCLGPCSGGAGLFPEFLGALNAFLFRCYPGYIRFSPVFFGASDLFTFRSYPGHLCWLPGFDGVPRQFSHFRFMAFCRVPAHFRAKRRSWIRFLSESLTGSSVPVSNASSMPRVMSPAMPI
jgi:hypothetical protein